MLRVALLKPTSRGPNSWRSIRNYAENIVESSLGLFDVEEVDVTSDPARSLMDGSRLRIRGRVSDADVVHLTHNWLGPYIRALASKPTVLTLHDFLPSMFEEASPAAKFMRWRFDRLQRGIGQLPLVFANSECTARDAVEQLGILPEQVMAVPVAIARAFYEERPPAARVPGLPEGPVVLSIGSHAAYKNLPLLLTAMAEPELRGASLLRVGTRFSGEQERLINHLGIGGRVFEAGGPDLVRLLGLMRTATVLAQPSVYEGFGMPVAEAMAAGLPVVCSDGGALPEVAGDGAWIVPLEQKRYGQVNYNDVRKFAEGLATVIESPQVQEELRHRGAANARRFHPETIGPRMRAAYEQVVERAS